MSARAPAWQRRRRRCPHPPGPADRPGLTERYPDAHCELDFSTQLELLVATILSAQTTDVRVHLLTPALFPATGARRLRRADRSELESLIQPTGFFRAKTDSLMKLGAALVADFEGEVPKPAEPAGDAARRGRKTANVVLGNAFDIPGITVDTHVGGCPAGSGQHEQDPVKVESDLAALFPPAGTGRCCRTG